MSGELQTIPARHGVATFVPRGRTIKIINTYGKQVVSTWAFSLNEPPEKGDDDEEEEDAEEIEEKTKELEKEVEKGGKPEKVEKKDEKPEGDAKEKLEEEVEKPKTDAEKPEEKIDESAKKDDSEADDPPEQAPDTPENEKMTESTASDKKGGKRTWASYLPSIPYGKKAATDNAKPDPEAEKAEKAQNEANTKKWSSYLPTGKGFSSYVPNVQIPDSKTAISAFKSSHYRDPNKSYAEQLYDFSKTPVGAGGLAAATGSGTASSIYAAYSAYTKFSASSSTQPPMEYLSFPHTRSATNHLVPSVSDTLLTNLRAPILTLIEDTTPGAHDTLTAACDASLYAALGVDKPEEHGSCAENLVLALKELNEKAGLKGTKAVGADITVNIAPTPLHLFMNAPIELDGEGKGEGAGAKGATFKVDEPKGPKRGYVKFRAERDVVVIMSACPMDVGKQNGGKCMAANFMVEETEEGEKFGGKSDTKKPLKKPAKKLATKKTEEKKEAPKEAPSKENGDSEQKKEPESEPEPQNQTPDKEETDKTEETPKPMPKPRGGPAKFANAGKKDPMNPDAHPKDSNEKPKEASSSPQTASKESTNPESEKQDSTKDKDEPSEAPKPKKKPKKLERRAPGTPSAKSESS
ncbi:hypothetical protein BCR34DRAFT_389436 [Clohesyomyces aquaticus]|uniref:DUF1989 domain-containing protein n=1 Tax=Clohesyomyces aquaticus TaxID=1231657 RepID=A0A1Y1ZFT2_9PLEO|nr:hypothetical protein BCR34DRAFT_389436 [Clohesyomyces aquaticus]